MVEWKKLGDVCVDIIVPMRDRPKVFDGTIPWCRIEDIEGMYFNTSQSGLMVSDKVINKMNLKVFPTGTVICSCSATLGVCAINTRPLITNQTFIGLVCSEKILNRFLYYYMLTRKKELLSLSTTGTIPYVSRAKFETMLIPIPSLSEQQHIVSILDTFTSSISNLKQQIEERRKQYEYERDLLLDLEGKEGVEMKKLGEVFSFKNGLNKGKEFFGKGKPIIMFTNVFNSRFITKAMIKSRVDISEQELERINAQIGDVFFTRTSETKEDVGYASVLVEDMEECTFAGFLIRARPITHKMLPQYCKYCFSTPKVRNAIVSKSSFTTRASLTGSGLGEVIIPLPPLSTQSRIVSILDTFEQSIANLEEQLAMREKQYEYYREKLLRFEEA